MWLPRWEGFFEVMFMSEITKIRFTKTRNLKSPVCLRSL